MIFLNFGTELINLSQVYQIDLKDKGDGRGVVIAFFYHLAGSTSGGAKISGPFRNIDAAHNALVSLGINIRPVNEQAAPEYYDASQVPTERTNTRIEPTRRKK